MFTGLIERVGEVTGVEPMSGGHRLTVRTSMAGELAPGDSIAVNGVCLTVVTLSADEFRVEVSPETVRVSSLGDARVGSLVNLERPLRADARLGGHFVLGHVDAAGELRSVRVEGEFRRVRIGFPPALAAYLVPKGSIAVDGISLTIADLVPDTFDVQIIPFTWEQTNLQGLRPGARVNLECDILGKYVVRLAGLSGSTPAGQATRRRGRRNRNSP